MEPDATDALDEVIGGLSDDDLDAWAEGTRSPFGEAMTDLAATWDADLDAMLGPDPNAAAWDRWIEGVYLNLPCGNGAPDLSLWPHTVPPPPVDAPDRWDRTRAFLRARLLASDACTVTLAALLLEQMATVEILAR